MRILYLHQHFVARTGTSGGRSHEFSRLWVRKGHAVFLITGAYGQSGITLAPGQRRAEHTIDGIHVRVLGVPYNQRLSMRRRLLAFARFVVAACREALRVGQVDVVFATSTPLTIAIPGMWAAWWHRCPFVFEVRDLWPAAPIELGILKNRFLIWLAHRLERIAYRRAAHVVALSPGMKDGIVAAGAAPEKVSVLPNSSDVELFRVPPEAGIDYRAEQGEVGTRPWVVYAGTFGRVNGVEWAIRLAEAVARLDPRIVFWLMGSGSERPAVIAEAAARGVLDRTVFFRDPVPRSQLPRVLSGATVLSSFCRDLPVLRTNSANKFFDAFAAGRPVLINYGGWQGEILEREGAGLVLDPTRIEESARRLVVCLSDSEWLKRAGEASRRLGETVFNRVRIADALEKVLEDVIARRRAERRPTRAEKCIH